MITYRYLAKLEDESPTVMVGDRKKNKKTGEIRGILKPSWAFVETKNAEYGSKCAHTFLANVLQCMENPHIGNIMI